MSTTNPTTGADIVEISGTTPSSGQGVGATGSAVPANAQLIGGGAAGGAGNLTAATVKAASTAAAATDTGLVVQQLARVATANPTNGSNGNPVPVMVDKAGRMVVTEGNVRELIGVQQTAYGAVTTEQTIITSGGAGVFCDLIGLVITTVNAAAATLTVRDATGGTTRMILNYPNTGAAPTTPLVLSFNPPIPQAAAANNWTIQASASATGFNITAVFAKNL